MLHDQFGGEKPRLGRRRDISIRAKGNIASAVKYSGETRLVATASQKFGGRLMGLGRLPSGGELARRRSWMREMLIYVRRYSSMLREWRSGHQKSSRDQTSPRRKSG